MKRFAVIFLVIVLALTFAACASKTTSDNDTTSTDKTTSVADSTTLGDNDVIMPEDWFSAN